MTAFAVWCFIVAPLIAWALTIPTLPKDQR